METFISGFYAVAFVVFFIYFFVLFYLSLQKCFFAEGKSKIKFFFLSLLTSPYLTYLEVVYLSTIAVCFIDLKVIEGVNNRTTFAEKEVFLMCFIIAVVYLLIILFIATNE